MNSKSRVRHQELSEWFSRAQPVSCFGWMAGDTTWKRRHHLLLEHTPLQYWKRQRECVSVYMYDMCICKHKRIQWVKNKQVIHVSISSKEDDFSPIIQEEFSWSLPYLVGVKYHLSCFSCRKKMSVFSW